MRRLIASLIGGAAGVALLLAGLGIDAYLHAGDPTLAEREGIFALSNPGHLLLGIGIALVCGGIMSAGHAAWGMTKGPGLLGRPAARHLTLMASAFASVAAVGLALSASASGHDHGGGMAGAADAHTDGTAATEARLADFTAGLTAVDDAVAHADAGAPAISSDAMAASDASHTHAAATAAPSASRATDGHMHSDMPDTSMDGAAAMTNAHERPKPTAEEIMCRVELTARAKEAAARFADVNVALAEGYIAPPDGKTHYGNPAYMRDFVSLDLNKPETLVYIDGADGAKVLAGVMFRALKGTGPQPCGNATWWHTHTHCVDNATGKAIPDTGDRACPEGQTQVEGKVEMMHLWFLPRDRR